MTAPLEMQGPLHLTPDRGLTTHWEAGSSLRHKLETYGNLKPAEALALLYDLQLAENDNPDDMAVIDAIRNRKGIFRSYAHHPRFINAYTKLWDHFEKHDGEIYDDTQKSFKGRVHADLSNLALRGFLQDGGSGAVNLSEENTLVFHYTLQKQERTGPVYVFDGPFHSTLATDSLPDSDIVLPSARNGKHQVAGFAEYTAHTGSQKFEEQAENYQSRIDKYARYGYSSGLLFSQRPPIMFIIPRLDDRTLIEEVKKKVPHASFGWIYSVHTYGKFMEKVRKSLKHSRNVKENIQWLQEQYEPKSKKQLKIYPA